MEMGNSMFSLYVNENRNHLDLSLYECGHEICGPGHCFGPAERQFYLIHYIIEGKGVYIINNKKYSLTKGSAFIIPPDIETTYIADELDPWEYSWIGFHGLKVKSMFEKAGYLVDDNYIITLEDSGEFASLIDKIVDLEKRKPHSEYYLLGYLYLLFATLIDYNGEGKVKKYENDSDVLYEIINYIQDNYYKDIKIGEIAKKFGINRTYLSKLFKDKMDISPQKYLINYRLSHALILLKEPSLNTMTVSEMVGYKDYHHFLKIFKSRYKVTPKQYRKDPFETSKS